MRRDIEREITYPHPVERVWGALTDPDALAAWLMPNDFKPEVGHRFQFRTDPAPGFDGVIDCVVLSIEQPSRLEISWEGGPVDAVVSWHLERVDEGTRMRFAMRGFEGPKAVAVSYFLGAGFKPMYHRDLPVVLQQLATGQPPKKPTKQDRSEGTVQRGRRRAARLLQPRR